MDRGMKRQRKRDAATTGSVLFGKVARQVGLRS
jgi:hypothetical protein